MTPTRLQVAAVRQRGKTTAIYNHEEQEPPRYFWVGKMAQGTKKFKAQRPGSTKKHQQNKPKGLKKGGMMLTSFPSH